MSRKKRQPRRPDPVYRPHDPKLTDVYIFDMDGTLALLGGRSPYAPETCVHDPVHAPVMRVQKLLAKDYRIIILSGRENKYRRQTEAWLQQHGVKYYELFMRVTGDKRNDAIIKAEIFRDKIAPNYNVLAAFDDRDRVVKMWRWLGVPCFQVQDGDF